MLMLLDMIRKGAKQMRFTKVEALQGSHKFLLVLQERVRQQCTKMCTDCLCDLFPLLAIREEELAFTFFLGQTN